MATQSVTHAVAVDLALPVRVSVEDLTAATDWDTGSPFLQMLVTDDRGELGGHVLVIILSPWFDLPEAPEIGDPPDDWDTPGRRHCGYCIWGGCLHSCGYYSYNYYYNYSRYWWR
jgi:hypothetical protein